MDARAQIQLVRVGLKRDRRSIGAHVDLLAALLQADTISGHVQPLGGRGITDTYIAAAENRELLIERASSSERPHSEALSGLSGSADISLECGIDGAVLLSAFRAAHLQRRACIRSLRGEKVKRAAHESRVPF